MLVVLKLYIEVKVVVNVMEVVVVGRLVTSVLEVEMVVVVVVFDIFVVIFAVVVDDVAASGWKQ